MGGFRSLKVKQKSGIEQLITNKLELKKSIGCFCFLNFFKFNLKLAHSHYFLRIDWSNKIGNREQQKSTKFIYKFYSIVQK